jgi:two-component system sensor histidine kinase YesM
MTAALNNDNVVSDMTYTLSNFFRYSISKGEEITLVFNEIDLIRNYLKIQQFRYKDKFMCKYDIPEELLVLKMPRLILQPIVENAIYHGLEIKREKRKHIHLRITQ